MDHESTLQTNTPAAIRLQPNRIAFILAAGAASLTLMGLATQFVRYGLGHDHVYGPLPIAEPNSGTRHDSLQPCVIRERWQWHMGAPAHRSRDVVVPRKRVRSRRLLTTVDG